MSNDKKTPVNLSTNIARKSLPFKIAPKIQTIEIGDESLGIIEIKVYGGLTNGEAVELQRLIREKEFVRLSKQYNNASEEEIKKLVEEEMLVTELAGFILDYSCDIATIIIASRVVDGWTFEDTKALPVALVNEIAAFMQQEIVASGKDRTAQIVASQASGDEDPKAI